MRWIVGFLLLVGITIFAAYAANSRVQGQWEATDSDVRAWYRELKQPDNPSISCCGEADAYWADDFFVRDGKSYAIITDTRPDQPLGRPHIPPGTEIEIPVHKYKFDAGNPTGHGVIFITSRTNVLCYVAAGGV